MNVFKGMNNSIDDLEEPPPVIVKRGPTRVRDTASEMRSRQGDEEDVFGGWLDLLVKIKMDGRQLLVNLKRFSGVGLFLLTVTYLKQRWYSSYLLNNKVFGLDGRLTLT